jgi:hypothetical protein
MRAFTRTLVTASSALTLAAASMVLATGSAQAATCSQSYLPLPDPTCTPGVYNSAVTQSTIKSTICVSGWTATVRPPTSYTNPLKVEQIAEYGYKDTSTSSYEEDHFIPLELGGDPRNPKNLWPEPYSGTKTATTKDGVETKLKNAVCKGTITLSAARTAMKNNWTTALSVTGIG